MPGRTLRAANLGDVVQAVGDGNQRPEYSGENVVEVTLWDGRKVVANYHEGQGKIDAKSSYDFFLNDLPLESLVERLINEGTPFITQTGEDDLVCILQWTIQ